MSLASALSGQKAAVASALPPETVARIGRSIEELEASGLARRAAGPGERIALPVLDGVDGAPVDLGGLAAGRPAVLVFYRGGWCPYCNVALRAYATRFPDIEAAGGVLVAVTPEDPAHAAETARNNALPFPVAIDRGNRFARSLGLVFALPEDLRPLHRAIGIDLPARNGDASHELPIPATYVLDRHGHIVWAHVEADFTTRGEPADALAALRDVARDGGTDART